MSHRQIEAFRAVMTSPTMTEASRRLRTSQPSVSRLISDLERSLGLALFERRQGRISPTPEGLLLFEEVERSFTSLDHILQLAAEIRDFREAQLTVAGMPALCLDLLPEAIHRFLKDYPKVQIALHARSSREIVSWVLSKRVELGLATPPFDVRGIKPTIVVETPCVCALPVGHPLADREVITISDIKQEPIILVSNSNIRDDLEEVFRSAGTRLAPIIETPLSIVAARHVELGMGVAIIEPYTAAYLINRPIVFRQFRPRVPFVYGIFRSDERQPSKALLAFNEILEEQLTGLDLPASSDQKISIFSR